MQAQEQEDRYEQRPEPKMRTISYCHLSDEKAQISATTHENTIQMLDDIFDKRKEMEWDDLKMIIDITNGCAAQYKCYTALYTLALIANSKERIFINKDNSYT